MALMFTAVRRAVSAHAWSIASGLIALIVALPLIAVVSSVFQDSGGDFAHVARTRLPTYLSNTLALCAGVVLVSTLIGVSTAWLVTRCRFAGSRFFAWALLLPLATPTYLGAYVYTDLLQFAGPLQRWVRETFHLATDQAVLPPIRSLTGAIVILSLSLYPYVFLAARTAFLECGGSAWEASRTLGAGPWRTFMSISLRVARPAIVAGAALVLMETLAEFGAVDYFAIDTFATGIYRTWIGLGSLTAAAQLASCVLAGVVVLLAIERIARRGARYHSATSTPRQVPPVRLRAGAASLAFAACAVPVLLGFIVPLARFAQLTLERGDARAYELFLGHGANSFKVALLAAGTITVMAFILAYALRLRPTSLTAAVVRFAATGYAIPGTVIAVGFLIPLAWLDHRINDIASHFFNARPGLILTGSIVAILLGYQTRFLAVALGLIESGLGRVRPSLDDAARTLGASRWRLLRSIHLPLLRGSVGAAVLLVFVDVIKELPATLILRPFGFETIAVRVYQLASDERLDEAATGALAIMLLGVLPAIVLARLVGRRKLEEVHL